MGFGLEPKGERRRRRSRGGGQSEKEIQAEQRHETVAHFSRGREKREDEMEKGSSVSSWRRREF